jgi:hypothetical protein
VKLRAAGISALMVAAVLACAPVPVTPSATTGSAPASAASPVPTSAEAWSVVNLAQPSVVTDAPSLEPGYQCSPCHPAAASQLAAVSPTSMGVIAVGVQQPPAQAIAFLSTDGLHWTDLPGFEAATGTGANAVASSGEREVIVGQETGGATAWASDGAGWQQAPAQTDLHVAFAAGAMTSVTSFAGGFVAAGYRDDPLHAKASGAVWRSTDGLAWHLDEASTIFNDGRIWGVAATEDVLVAVGTTGDPNYGPAAAWSWTTAGGWQSAQIMPSSAGAMRAVAAGPNGFVAVGLNGHDDGALVWTSPNGRVWTAVADQPSLHYASAVRMQSVVATSTGFVAGGWRSDAGNGSAVAWTSADGLTWTQMPWQPSLSGGEMTGVAATGGTIVAVGRTGYPDNNQATIWAGSRP